MTDDEFDVNHFFDSFPVFYDTSSTGSSPNRLNSRFGALIQSNKNIIKNSTILDLASHDGRWSLAALKNGAAKVFGIEAREELVKKSYENMERYKISKKSFNFLTGDIFDEIDKLKPKEFDIVFCFGIFYHIMDHLLLISKIKNLQPKYLILDTNVEVSDKPVIFMREESAVLEGDPVPNVLIKNKKYIMGRPSKSALSMMLRYAGFDYKYYNWKNSGITNWENIETYRDEKRLTVVAKNLS